MELILESNTYFHARSSLSSRLTSNVTSTPRSCSEMFVSWIGKQRECCHSDTISFAYFSTLILVLLHMEPRYQFQETSICLWPELLASTIRT